MSLPKLRLLRYQNQAPTISSCFPGMKQVMPNILQIMRLELRTISAITSPRGGCVHAPAMAMKCLSFLRRVVSCGFVGSTLLLSGYVRHSGITGIERILSIDKTRKTQSSGIFEKEAFILVLSIDTCLRQDGSSSIRVRECDTGGTPFEGLSDGSR